MKRYLISAILSCSVVTAAYCQPKIAAVGDETIDMGRVYNTGAHIKQQFTIKNTGNQPLKINGVRTSCGCTAALPSDSTVLPGEQAHIDVDFNPMGYRGDVTKEIYIATNDPSAQMTTLKLKMDIVYALQSEPNFILFPNPVVGKPDTSAITLTNSSNEVIMITGIETNSKEISSRVDNETLKPGGMTRLQLFLVGEKPGPVYGQIVIHTSSGLQPTLAVRYYAGVNSR